MLLVVAVMVSTSWGLLVDEEPEAETEAESTEVAEVAEPAEVETPAETPAAPSAKLTLSEEIALIKEELAKIEAELPPLGPAGPDDLDDEEHDEINELAQLKKQIADLKIPTKKHMASKVDALTTYSTLEKDVSKLTRDQ